MTQLTTGEAANLYGCDRSKLARWRKTGKLSATRHTDGTYRFALSELIRAFGEPPQQDTPHTTGNTAAHDSAITTAQQQVIDQQQRMINMLTEQVREKDKQLAAALDVQRLLQHDKPKGILGKVFG